MLEARELGRLSIEMRAQAEGHAALRRLVVESLNLVQNVH